ncbi:uracil-xanthine permease family protein [Spiroplasma turonicum]|uniref:Uracil permease n=1 Tax=Spiroplasma turonicum TaxID=216946 RepID=A0A0K1P4Y4_9MOLU|nr:solute carrier family 23 protein [Spiroplasma turonicum]AKU79365.1 uracil permease [Spiroplasma turonicum]ALX70386.1 uracil permease [Spiroplasma turonicum]
MENNNIILQPRQRPKNITQWILLSFQHVFAMFGATVLVPLIINSYSKTGEDIINVSMALFCSGFGTLIYIALTAAKVPIYLGSSFAYMSILGIGYAEYGWGNAIFIGVFMVGVVYILFGFIIYWTGVKWIKKAFSPIVIGPIVVVIGLSPIKSALSNAGIIYNSSDFVGKSLYYPQWLALVIAFITFIVAAICMLKAKSFLKVIPILIALIVGYIVAIILHFSFKPLGYSLLETELITNTSKWAWYPSFKAIWDVQPSNIGPALVAIVPIAIVTMTEHLGDHINIGTMTNKDFIKDPGISRTLMADGVAMSLAGLIGGPANATYSENTSVVSITKVASVWVTGLAAIFAIIMSFIAPINQLIMMIPLPVMGAISIVLFGMISSNGIKILIDSKVDFKNAKNILVISLILSIGVGMALTDSVIKIGESFNITGMFLATIVGIIANLLLPNQDNLGILNIFKFKKKTLTEKNKGKITKDKNNKSKVKNK